MRRTLAPSAIRMPISRPPQRQPLAGPRVESERGQEQRDDREDPAPAATSRWLPKWLLTSSITAAAERIVNAGIRSATAVRMICRVAGTPRGVSARM